MNLKLAEIFVRLVVNKNQKHPAQPMLGAASPSVIFFGFVFVDRIYALH
jgi:hypothetical protein